MSRFTHVISTVLPDVIDVVRRFPIVVLIAVLLTVYALNGVSFNSDISFGCFALIAMFFTSLGISLLTEVRGWSGWFGVGVNLLICTVVGLLFYFSDRVFLTREMLVVALAIGAGALPYMFSSQNDKSYWMFNHSYWFSLFVAGAGGFLIAGLVSLLLAAFSTLFEWRISSDIYGYSFIISMFLIAPVFWLSMLPGSFAEEVSEGQPTEFTSRVTALFVKYVFVPFFFLFALLFHGVGVKIGFEQSFPKGQIGWFGLFFIIGGVGTFLMAFPTRQVSGPLVRFFYHYWYWFLIVPLVLLFMAHYLRLEEYGMTPLRFYMMGLFVWALVLIFYSLYVRFKGKSFDLRIISVLAVIILGLSSFGPFGAEAVSIQWQKQRLVQMLADMQLLKDGVIVKPAVTEGPSVSKNEGAVRSVLKFFNKRNRADSLSPLLSADILKDVAETNVDDAKWPRRNSKLYIALETALGLRNSVVKKNWVLHSFYANHMMILPVSQPGKLVGQFTSISGDLTKTPSLRKEIGIGGEMVDFGVQFGKTSLEVSQGTEQIGSFTYQSIIKAARAFSELRNDKSIKKKSIGGVPLIIEKEVGSGLEGARLYVVNMNYHVSQNKEKAGVLNYIKFWVFKPGN